MKKIGIITLNGNTNFGNRLQNYALQEIVKKIDNNIEVSSIWVKENSFVRFVKDSIKHILKRIKKNENKNTTRRYKNFKKFTDNNIKVYYVKKNKLNNLDSIFDNYIVGSDQVWNQTELKKNELCLCSFSQKENIISYAASFGTSKISTECIDILKKEISKFKYISVREKSGMDIILKYTEKKDVIVTVDPTMLLTKQEWEKIEKMPEVKLPKKYILNYFLGNISEKAKEEINRIANEYDCEIINILDITDKYYVSGPSEFLTLIKNAFLICTDSFHSCVFSIIYNKPFVVFERLGSKENMNSRIETLLETFDFKERMFKDTINNKLLECDYEKANKILEEQAYIGKNFLRKAIIGNERDKNG